MVVETRSERRTVMRGDITDGSNSSLRQYLPMWTYVYGMWGREGGGSGIRGVDDWWVMQSDTFRGGARFTVSVSTHGTR